MVAHAFKPSPWEVDAVGLFESEATQGFVMRPHLKQRSANRETSLNATIVGLHRRVQQMGTGHEGSKKTQGINFAQMWSWGLVEEKADFWFSHDRRRK